jgi:hypothetical protein
MVAGAHQEAARRKANATLAALVARKVPASLLQEVVPTVDALLDACNAVEVVRTEAFDVTETLREELELGNVLNWMDPPP